MTSRSWTTPAAHALGLMVLPIVRPAIAGPTPMHVVDAPMPGTGKSLLVRVCLAAAFGGNVVATGASKDEEELRKKLMAALVSGAPYVFMDNLDGTLDSGTLAGILTAERWKDRYMGTMTEVEAPVRCVWVATANNVQMSTDIARRSAWIRIDARSESPTQREGFRHPKIEMWVAQNRKTIVSALVCLARGWVDAGMPGSDGRLLASFESWSEVVGGVLAVTGVPGFLANADDLRESVLGIEANWANFYRRWLELFGSSPMKVGELLSLFKDDELGALLDGARSEASERTRLGNMLRKRVGLVSGGLRIERAADDTHTKVLQYRIVPVEPTPRAATPATPALSDQTPAMPVEPENVDFAGLRWLRGL